jgi:hypothetical protein
VRVRRSAGARCEPLSGGAQRSARQPPLGCIALQPIRRAGVAGSPGRTAVVAVQRALGREGRADEGAKVIGWVFQAQLEGEATRVREEDRIHRARRRDARGWAGRPKTARRVRSCLVCRVCLVLPSSRLVLSCLVSSTVGRARDACLVNAWAGSRESNFQT